jgi:outer membrane protein OmpA-like peptidoglycan-associated protein
MEGAQPSEEAQPQTTPTEPMEGAQPSQEAEPQAQPTEPMEEAPAPMGTETGAMQELPAGSAAATLQSEAQSPTGTSKWVTLDTVKFDTGSATLSAESDEQIGQVAEILTQNSDVKIEIGGFTDSTGSAKVNQQLSQERADAVRQALIDKGVDASRIEAKGYGEKQPAVKTAGASAENRRVAARIIAG